MLGFVIRRLAWMVVTLWIVFTVTFFLMRSAPGGPFSRERKTDPLIEAQLKRRYHLDEPLIQQYGRELKNFVTLDLGFSFKSVDFSVNEIIRQGLPVSASLGIFALVFALVLGLTAGIFSAVRRGSLLDAGLMTLATIGIAVPSFVIASLAIIMFVFIVPIFPAAGWGSLSQLVLPALCLGAPYAAYIARLTRSGMLDVLGQDYIRTAYAKGLPRGRVIFRHALKGAMLPVVSFLGPAIAGILTGSMVVEQIFAVPGLGQHFVQAATQRDYTLCMGLVMLYTALLYGMNMLVDLTYQFLDPRIKLD